MPVTREQAGIYILLSHRLRLHPASGPHRETERPHRVVRSPTGDEVVYLDTDTPTLVEIREGDRESVPFLLRSGAIAPYVKPRKRDPQAGTPKGGEPSGEAAGE